MEEIIDLKDEEIEEVEEIIDLIDEEIEEVEEIIDLIDEEIEEVEEIEPESEPKESIPPRSKQLYEQTYNAYKRWCLRQRISKTTEDTIFEYFNTDFASFKTSTLWTKYSILRTTIYLNEGIDISKFPNVIPFLKGKGKVCKTKQTYALTKEDVNSFLLTANDEQHLLHKVILIFGIAGGCRRQELISLTVDDVEDREKYFLIKLADAKSKKNKSFVILPGENDIIQPIRKYISLRPNITNHKRFFINYQKERCTAQPIGIHKIGGVPSTVAKFLKLPDSDNYTAHCFRWTSASFFG